ncbi:MAG: TIGR00725 family protein [Anaerolineales bacterium]|nr:MAG: TIGR00725 family protein [Anaerolineales bacterium]
MKRKSIVSVIGSSECSEWEAQAAESVGRLLASNDVTVICGGRGGVMEAVCRGAQEAGGVTVGILPGLAVEEGNRYLTISIPTGLGEGRNAIIARAGQAVIAIGGRFGTLSEIAFALKMGKQVVGLRTWDPLYADGGRTPIQIVETPEEAVELVLEEIR